MQLEVRDRPVVGACFTFSTANFFGTFKLIALMDAVYAYRCPDQSSKKEALAFLNV
jgi:hypothetical protein